MIKLKRNNSFSIILFILIIAAALALVFFRNQIEQPFFAANLKTHVYTNGGTLEFKYPANWYANSNDIFQYTDTIRNFQGEWDKRTNGINMQINARGNKVPGYTLDDILPCHSSDYSYLITTSCTDGKINGASYRKLVGYASDTREVKGFTEVKMVIIGNSRYYNIDTIINQGNQHSQNIKAVDLILNTFKFTDLPETTIPNWKTYVSPEYIIVHRYDNADAKPEERHVQFSLQYSDDWRIVSGNYPSVVALEKGANKISVINFDNQTAQSCAYEVHQRKIFQYIYSPYANLQRVESLPNPSSNISEFIICAQDEGPFGYADITRMGRIIFDLPKDYNQNDLNEMDLIISTLRRLK